MSLTTPKLVLAPAASVAPVPPLATKTVPVTLSAVPDILPVILASMVPAVAIAAVPPGSVVAIPTLNTGEVTPLLAS